MPRNQPDARVANRGRKQALLIMAHANMEQLCCLLDLVDSERFDIFLHADSKFRAFDAELVCTHVKKSTLTLLPRASLAWGGPSLVRCELNLMRAAVESGHYSYLHLISGMDLPLRRPESIWSFFDEHAGFEFVGFGRSQLDGTFNRSDRRRSGTYRLFAECGQTKPWYQIAGACSRLQQAIGIDRTRKSGLTFGRGCEWFSITEDFARWVLSREPLVRRYFCNKTYCCDEVFMQTLLLSSPFSAKVWKPGGNEFEQCMRLIDWERGAPYVWRSGDFKEIVGSEMMFARKFDQRVDARVIKEIYQRALGSTCPFCGQEVSNER